MNNFGKSSIINRQLVEALKTVCSKIVQSLITQKHNIPRFDTKTLTSASRAIRAEY